MALINPYLHFNGNAEEAFNFYKSVFGGEFAKITRYKDISSPEFPVAEKDANRIMHIAMPIGKSNVLMASDVLEHMGQVRENDNRFKISIIITVEPTSMFFNVCPNSFSNPWESRSRICCRQRWSVSSLEYI